tara:strand:+ start:362 stop:541 length:180 start_codon:yes stop_codon:yes gene_type:complete
MILALAVIPMLVTAAWTLAVNLVEIQAVAVAAWILEQHQMMVMMVVMIVKILMYLQVAA